MMRLYQQLYIAQPQTNAGQRTVGKITAPIELIEYTVLFGNRNADAIIRHPYRQLVILQKAIYNNMHRLARILYGVLYQITDNIRNMHRVCRYQSLRTEMGFNSNILTLRNMSELDNLSAYLSKIRDMTRADDEHTQLSVRTFDIKTSLEKLVRLYHVPEGKDVAIEEY